MLAQAMSSSRLAKVFTTDPVNAKKSAQSNQSEFNILIKGDKIAKASYSSTSRTPRPLHHHHQRYTIAVSM
jgi:hypothetical protein